MCCCSCLEFFLQYSGLVWLANTHTCFISQCHLYEKLPLMLLPQCRWGSLLSSPPLSFLWMALCMFVMVFFWIMYVVNVSVLYSAVSAVIPGVHFPVDGFLHTAGPSSVQAWGRCCQRINFQCLKQKAALHKTCPCSHREGLGWALGGDQVLRAWLVLKVPSLLHVRQLKHNLRFVESAWANGLNQGLCRIYWAAPVTCFISPLCCFFFLKHKKKIARSAFIWVDKYSILSKNVKTPKSNKL